MCNGGKVVRKYTTAECTKTKNYVVGSYTGTGAVQHIDLGFRPSFVIISGMQGNTAINSPTIPQGLRPLGDSPFYLNAM